MKHRVPAFLFAVLASAGPVAADSRPCTIFAEAIRTSFETDADLDRVYARLADGPAWRAEGVSLSPAGEPGRPRNLTVGRTRLRAIFAAPASEAGFSPATTRHIELRRADAPARPVCRLRLVGESSGRIADMRPSDAAAEFARRAPMAALEPVLPALARALLAAPGTDLVALLGDGADAAADGTLSFPAGGARFALTLAPLPASGDEIQVTLARLVPELGNRGRPLGTFRYTVTTRLMQIDVE